MVAVSTFMFAAAVLGLLLLAVQWFALVSHLRQARPTIEAGPGLSVLKPLCGIDDDLEANLERFARLDYPNYEVLLGLESRRDPALSIARAACARWPGRFRIVLQRGEPGLNPKVNQLMTLAEAARHDVLVISDSNVRVHAGYLCEIAALLQDPGVGLVTHPVAGVGEHRLGSLMDSLHLAGSIAPGVVAAKRLARRDVVVGKSMAFRRSDLDALGGLAAVKDVLAEDYVLGLMVSSTLRKRVALAGTPVENVTQNRTVAEFARRYQRWHVMQRRSVGRLAYLALALLNPVLLAAIGALLRPTPAAIAGLTMVCAGKMTLDGATGRAMRRGGFRLAQLALVPAKDLIVGFAWMHGLVSDRVNWRGKRLRVLAGTRLEHTRRGEAPSAWGPLGGEQATALPVTPPGVTTGMAQSA